MFGINVKGEDCKLWVNEHKKQNGDVWYSYTTTVSKKDMTGNWVRSYQDITFTKNADPTGIPNGTEFDFEGWLSPRPYKTRDGKEATKTVIVINKASFKYNPQAAAESYNDSFEGLDEDVPFN